MSAKVIQCELGITRSSNGKYYIRIGCETSHTNFCELELTGEQFAEAITGLYSSDIKGSIKGLDRVGKTRVREARSVVCSLKTWDRDVLQQWLLENCQEEGWLIDAYLGSQTSIKTVEDGTQLNYSVFKYIEV
jgi:hypothetical protein